MHFMFDPALAGIISGAIKFIFVIGLIVGALIVLGIVSLFRR